MQAIPAASTPAAGETVPHGDHNPHFGGLVLMNGDLHFEVVLGRNGGARVYFSDATRNELPAATASDVTVTITRKSQAPEIVALHIDDSGESWVGRGSPVADPAGDGAGRLHVARQAILHRCALPVAQVNGEDGGNGITRSNEAAENNRQEFILRSAAALC